MSVLSGDRTYTFQSCVAPPSCSCTRRVWLRLDTPSASVLQQNSAREHVQCASHTFFGNVVATFPRHMGMTSDVRVSLFSRFCTQVVKHLSDKRAPVSVHAAAEIQARNAHRTKLKLVPNHFCRVYALRRVMLVSHETPNWLTQHQHREQHRYSLGHTAYRVMTHVVKV